MTNFPGPPAWAALTAYTQTQSEVANANYYYICTQSGTSGASNPFTANSAASVFNSPITDGTVTWVAAQRSRASWSASKVYTSGLPYTTTASVTTLGGTLRNVPVAQFIPLGAQFVSGAFVDLSPPTATVTAVNAAASIVNVSALSSGTGSGHVVIFNQGVYPYPDQIVTNPGASGSVIVQCVSSGTSGSGSQPTWPTASQLTKDASGNPEFNVVTDGTVTWQATGPTSATVPTWTANHTYPAPASVSAGGQWWYTTNGGTSGSSTPPWTYILDGSAQWAVVAVN